MLHSWSLGEDGNGTTVRTSLFYGKAFDLIHHVYWLESFVSSVNYQIASSTVLQIFYRTDPSGLNLHQCFSEWGPTPAGVPQGTKLGPWLFVLVNDLDTNAQQKNMWTTPQCQRY